MITDEGEKTVCKVRGICLIYHAKHFVSFQIIRAMNLEQRENVVNVHTERKIKRIKGRGKVAKVTGQDKRCRLSFNRRRMHGHSSALLGINRGVFQGS